jgi:hypothetical protein
MTQIPGGGDAVHVTSRILLDVSPLDLTSITIESTGRLVLSPHIDIDLRVNFILIKGDMHIGSEECPYPARAHITLLGKYNTSIS